MKHTKLALFFAFFALARAADDDKKREALLSQCGRSLKHGVYFGEIADLDDFPWLALLQYDTPEGDLKVLCGGVLISEQYVLTAAHCVDSSSNKLHGVILDEYNTKTNPDCLTDTDGTFFCNHFVRNLDVDEVIVHESYDPLAQIGTVADLALLKLSTKLEFTWFIQPICLPQAPAKAHDYLVGGWGKSMASGGEGFAVKRASYARVLSAEQCFKFPVTPDYNDEEHLCAGARQSVCIADGGGPLMDFEAKSDRSARITVFGVSTMDLTCKIKGVPGVYTKVHKYLPWIEKQIFI